MEFDFFLEPHGVIAEEHLHPKQQETMEVVAGAVRGRLGGEDRVARAGETVVVEPGTPHIWWNDGDEQAHLRVQFRPAMRTDELFETFFGLARDGKTNDQGVPSFLQLAVLLREYEDEVYPAKVPTPIVKTLFRILAPIGRLRGYRAHYPEYDAAGEPASTAT
jgi:hypothetical protein